MLDPPLSLMTTNLVGRRIDRKDLAFVSEVWNDPAVAPTAGGVRTLAELAERIDVWGEHWKQHDAVRAP